MVAADKALQHKAAYLNVPFFVGRAGVYFLIWIALAYVFSKWSLAQDAGGTDPWAGKMEGIGGPGLLLYGHGHVLDDRLGHVARAALVLDHLRHSVYRRVGVSALAFVVAIVVAFAGRAPLSQVIAPRHLRDLGTLLFAFIMLWAYFSFSQFLLIWAGNPPNEIPFYSDAHARRLDVGRAVPGPVSLHSAVSFAPLARHQGQPQNHGVRGRRAALPARGGSLLAGGSHT